MDLTAKLAQLGFTLPPIPKPVGAYAPCVHVGDLVFVSGQVPQRDGKPLAVGKVPSAVSIDAAQKAAAQAAVQGLAIVNAELGGDLTRIVRVVRLGVYIQADPDFADLSKIANGASDLLLYVLGDAGKHARCTTGSAALPLNTTIEVDFLFQVK